MKVGDISLMRIRPKTVIVLSDYEKTEPPLRQILFSAADRIIRASAMVEEYRNAA